MSWQDKTSGGYPVRITARDPGSAYPIIGEVKIGHKTTPSRWTNEGKWVAPRAGFESNSPFDLVPVKPAEDPAGDWEPTDEEFQYAQDLCRVPKGTHDPVEFRKFVDKAKAGEVSFTCSFVWEGPEPIRAKVGDRIQHPNGCWLEITETGFKVNAALDTVEFGK
jgi:hypothetical protein